MDGKTKNLMQQVDALFKHTNQKSIQTRYRYLAAMQRFCEWLGQNTNLKKIKNIKAKYIYAYVDYLKNSGKSPGYIYVELSGIRYFCYLAECKNKLPENKKLNLQKRNFGGVQRAWTTEEVKKATELAEQMGRWDVSMAIKVCGSFGLRIEEAVTLTVRQVKDAICNRDLYLINTKGKRPRVIKIENTDQEDVLHYLLQYKKGQDKIFVQEHQYTHKVKKSIQNWIRNHSKDFQDADRVPNNMARELIRHFKDLKIKNTETPSANLTAHGLRHRYAISNYKKRLNEGMDKKEAKRDTSLQLGHSREDVTNIYLAGLKK